MTPRPPRAQRLVVTLGVLTLLGVAGSLAADPVLHEYFEFDGSPALEERSQRPTRAGEQPSLGGEEPSVSARGSSPQLEGNSLSRDASDHDSYQLDANTTRPEHVGYDDPFTPSIPPFKRLFAYDAVNAAFELVVRDAGLRELPVAAGHGPAAHTEDQFFADMGLMLAGGVAVRIPSVGPSSRVLAARLEPQVPFKLERDSAENWFITAASGGEFRLTMHLAIDRAVFGSPFGDPEWSSLSRFVGPVPSSVQKIARDTARQLGVLERDRPRQALSKLVDHFRSFAPSEALPSATTPSALLQEITESKKGVCRHRSYAFAVLGLALGLPTRFVRNEAHAWVEVYDGKLWHRLDLGGAAGEMELASSVDVAHVPPSDPFAWPDGSESAQDMAEDALAHGAAQGGRGSARGSQSAEPTDGAEDTEQAQTSSAPSAPSLPTALPKSSPTGTAAKVAEPLEAPDADLAEADEDSPDVVTDPHAEEVMQGSRVHVAGSARAQGQACALLRVDVLLVASDRRIIVGTLVTDQHGRYEGEITLPGHVPVGDYELRVEAANAGGCVAYQAP